MALLPNFTTSNNIMFSMPFSWWWPFIRPAPFTPLPFSPAAFFPFFPPWNKTSSNWVVNSSTLLREGNVHFKWSQWLKIKVLIFSYLSRASLSHNISQGTRAHHTFPLVEFALLPSGSSEKSVSDENRVSVSLEDTIKYHLKKKKKSPQLQLSNEKGKRLTEYKRTLMVFLVLLSFL